MLMRRPQSGRSRNASSNQSLITRLASRPPRNEEGRHVERGEEVHRVEYLVSEATKLCIFISVADEAGGHVGVKELVLFVIRSSLVMTRFSVLP
jgi:hypothetical protein